jgi:hypothetical protein
LVWIPSPSPSPPKGWPGCVCVCVCVCVGIDCCCCCGCCSFSVLHDSTMLSASSRAEGDDEGDGVDGVDGGGDLVWPSVVIGRPRPYSSALSVRRPALSASAPTFSFSSVVVGVFVFEGEWGRNWDGEPKLAACDCA